MHSSPSDDSESLASPAAESSNINGKRTIVAGGQNRKKQRKDDEVVDQSLGPEKEGAGKVKPTRGSRACTVCRRLKMKCVGAEHGPPCKRCQSGNNECIFEESNRGKRSSKKHELLTRSLRKMERTLDTVLRSISHPGTSALASGMVSRSPSPSANSQTAQTQALMNSPSPPTQEDISPSDFPPGSPKLHSLPDNSLNPLGLLAEASLSNRRAQIANNPSARTSFLQPEGSSKIGVASDVYFKPGPMTILPLRRLYIERQVQPEMLNFVSTDEVVDLFDIYFEHMNMHCSLLEKEFHTPSLVCSRSPFLLTTICAIASKFYSKKPELHPRLNNLAKSLAFSVPEQGYKSLEIVQAYLLLSLWGCGPVERYEQDKTWILLGMGIRMATDLNLHRKTATPPQHTSTDADHARAKEILNRERTWLLCYGLDRGISAQMGKPHSIKEDFIIRNANNWWRSAHCISSDSSLCAYVELQRIVSRSLDILYSGTSTASGLQTDCDYLLVTKAIETQINTWNNEWVSRRSTSGVGEYMPAHYKMMREFFVNYALLVVNSFGLQNALERSRVDIGHFFARCHAAATACATIVRDEIGPSGELRYCTDSAFVQCSYAVLSLLKFIHPEFQPFLDNEQKTISLIKDVADLLDRAAVSPLHTPALYSTLLRALISAKIDSSSTTPTSPPSNEGHGGNSRDQMLASIVQEPGNDGMAKPFGAITEPVMQSLDFQSTGEMGPVADMSTFPPRMAPSATEETPGLLSMESVLSSDFWESVLVPGYSNSLEGLSGGFVYGAGGNSVYIASRFGSPNASAITSPLMGIRPELTNSLT
ncbi:hypothetical protein JB92DRAFT_2743342 [Gautieria morchelliformis]|nr:hypothetical protein JB92DRAFT_2743342 [Gautieria morchelliformis]